MQVILFSSIAQALSSPRFGKSLTMFAPIRCADGDERARHCRPGWERCWPGNDEFTFRSGYPPEAERHVHREAGPQGRHAPNDRVCPVADFSPWELHRVEPPAKPHLDSEQIVSVTEIIEELAAQCCNGDTLPAIAHICVDNTRVFKPAIKELNFKKSLNLREVDEGMPQILLK